MMRQTLLLLTGILALLAIPFSTANAQGTQEEFGKCGYYADALHGKKTASGVLYDKGQLTCSHKSLPFGTNLRVTRLDNKKSVVVRVNDRGPFMDGYVVDVSRKAAEALGLIRDGVTKVKIEVVDPTPATAQPVAYSAKTLPADLEPTPYASASRVSSASEATSQLVKPKKPVIPTSTITPAAYSTASPAPQPQIAPATASAGAKVSEIYQIELKSVPNKSFGLQLAVLSNAENLFQEVSKLQATWPGKMIVNHESTGISTTYKLILGPYATRKEAEAQQKRAATKGFKSAFVVEFE
ncbi:MAG: septal ring lytic transglycosylase RlpA family protein [Lewinellaceae bacterium]|nr:septal ring lytic transglycosylase RlpA family protein [Lewinellaceae bacterium]